MATVKQELAQAAENFSLRVFSNPGLQKISHQALDDTGAWNQRRCPLPAQFVFTFVVVMNLFRDVSLKNLLEAVLELLRERSPGVTPQAVSPEALCKAKERLGVAPLKRGFEIVAAKIRPRCWFHGLRVYALDGTKADLPDTPRNEGEFGRPGASRGRSAFPQALLLALVDVQTHRVKATTINPCRMDERAASLPLLEQLGKRDLLLLDRGYAAAWYYYELDQRQIPFLVRCKTGSKPRRLHQLADGSWMVEVKGDAPNSAALREGWQGPRRVRNTLRMIEYRVGNSPIIRVLTNLLDPVKYPAHVLARLYANRWEGELVFDELKNHLATVTHGTMRTLFRSKRPEMVRQEAYGLLLAYNLVRETMTQAARRRDEDPLRLSFIGTLRCIRRTIHRAQSVSKKRLPYLLDQLLSDVSEQRLASERRDVAYPRKKKQKMSNFGVKQPHHKAEPRTREPQIVTDLGLCEQ